MNRVLRMHKLLGIIFLALLVLGVYLTYAAFSKTFVSYEEVKLETSSTGLQLPARADVKVRGVIVGEVLATDADADGAEITLGLFPDKTAEIPENVTGSIVPKTLFGEKYVSLVIPEQPEGTLTAGDVVERTEVGTEVEAVLNDLYPLLNTVSPADLNMTLNALATALEGRGDQLGENIETLDAYLKKLNPEIPQLLDDLRLTAQVSDIYADVLPQVGQILDDTVLTTGTLEDRETQLNNLFTDVSAFSDTARVFLAENEQNLIRLGEVTAPQVKLLAKYAPEIPCLTGGLVNAGKLQAEAFRGFKLHIVLETLPRQPRAYGPEDKPVFGDTRGPACINLPNPPWSQANPVRKQPDFVDGVDETTGKGTSRTAPGFGTDTTTPDDLFGYTGTPEDAGVLDAMMDEQRDGASSDTGLEVLLGGPLVGKAGD